MAEGGSGWLDFGVTALVAGAIAGMPAGVVLYRHRRWPASWALKLLVLLLATPVAAVAAFVMAAGVPLRNWTPLQTPPSRVVSLAGPDCYDLGTAAVYAHTVTGQILRVELDAPETRWIVVESVPTISESSYLCRDSPPARPSPATAISIRESGVDCGGETRVLLRSDGEVLVSREGSCAIVIFMTLSVGAILVVGLPFLACWPAYVRQRDDQVHA